MGKNKIEGQLVLKDIKSHNVTVNEVYRAEVYGAVLLMVSFLPLQHTSNLTLKEEANVKEKEQVFQNQKYIFGNFIERLWAYLNIQQLLEEA